MPHRCRSRHLPDAAQASSNHPCGWIRMACRPQSLHHGRVVPREGVEAGGRRCEVAVGDAAGEPVPDRGELPASPLACSAPEQPTPYELAEGTKALTELEARATVGKLVLLP